MPKAWCLVNPNPSGGVSQVSCASSFSGSNPLFSFHPECLELSANMNFESVVLVLILHGVFTVFRACVVQFRFSVAYAVFSVVSGLDMFWFGGLLRFLTCLICLHYVCRVISPFEY